jgi:hypothetical protein
VGVFLWARYPCTCAQRTSPRKPLYHCSPKKGFPLWRPFETPEFSMIRSCWGLFHFFRSFANKQRAPTAATSTSRFPFCLRTGPYNSLETQHRPTTVPLLWSCFLSLLTLSPEPIKGRTLSWPLSFRPSKVSNHNESTLEMGFSMQLGYCPLESGPDWDRGNLCLSATESCFTNN